MRSGGAGGADTVTLETLEEKEERQRAQAARDEAFALKAKVELEAKQVPQTTEKE